MKAINFTIGELVRLSSKPSETGRIINDNDVQYEIERIGWRWPEELEYAPLAGEEWIGRTVVFDLIERGRVVAVFNDDIDREHLVIDHQALMDTVRSHRFYATVLAEEVTRRTS